MSQTALEKFNPAALSAIIGTDAVSTVNDAFAGGITGGEYLPQLSIRGNRFRLKIQGEETVLPDLTVEAYLVNSRPNVSKTFYAGGYDPSAEAKGPNCSSADGHYPDQNVESPEAPNCQQCPNNAWGSKITDSGKKGKACNDYKLIVLVLAAAPEQPFALRIPAASLKSFAAYIQKLNMAGVPADAARTRLSLGDTEYPSLNFEFVDTVKNREEYLSLKAIAESAEVLNAVKIQPRPSTPAPETATAVQPVVAEVAPAVEAEKPSSLADLLGTAKKKATPKPKAEKPAPAPEPEPAEPVAEEPEAGTEIRSLEQLLGKLKKA